MAKAFNRSKGSLPDVGTSIPAPGDGKGEYGFSDSALDEQRQIVIFFPCRNHCTFFISLP